IGMMWGWLSAAAVRASRLKRSTMPSPMSSRAGASTLIATLRSRARSWARYTVAIPPRPSSASTSYSPSVALRRASSWAVWWGDGRRGGGAAAALAPPVVTGTLVPQRRQKYAPGAREVPQRAQWDCVSGAINRGLSSGPLNNTWAPGGQLVVAKAVSGPSRTQGSTAGRPSAPPARSRPRWSPSGGAYRAWRFECAVTTPCGGPQAAAGGPPAPRDRRPTPPPPAGPLRGPAQAPPHGPGHRAP